MWIELLHLLLVQVWAAFILYILFATDAVYEYGRRIPLVRTLLKFTEYEKESTFDPRENPDPFRGSYSLYMRVTYRHSLLVAVFSCPMCLGVWLSMIGGVVIGDFEYLPMAYFGSQLMFLGYRRCVELLAEDGEADG